MKLKKALLLLLLLLSSFTIRAQAVGQVIKKYVNYIGGKGQWKKVKTMVESGEYNYGGIQFPFTSFAKAPNRYKFVVPQSGKEYVQGFDGKGGWKLEEPYWILFIAITGLSTAYVFLSKRSMNRTGK